MPPRTQYFPVAGESPRRMTRGLRAKRACSLVTLIITNQKTLQIFKSTRGHARFARSPLVIRLGDSGYIRGGIEFRVAL